MSLSKPGQHGLCSQPTQHIMNSQQPYKGELLGVVTDLAILLRRILERSPGLLYPDPGRAASPRTQDAPQAVPEPAPPAPPPRRKRPDRRKRKDRPRTRPRRKKS